MIVTQWRLELVVSIKTLKIDWSKNFDSKLFVTTFVCKVYPGMGLCTMQNKSKLLWKWEKMMENQKPWLFIWYLNHTMLRCIVSMHIIEIDFDTRHSTTHSSTQVKVIVRRFHTKNWNFPYENNRQRTKDTVHSQLFQ